MEAVVQELRGHQVFLTRDQWLKEAEKCEEDGSLRTCGMRLGETIKVPIPRTTLVASADT